MECGSCPRCRLSVSSRSGRLRWCVAERAAQRRLCWASTAAALLLVLAALTAVLVLRLGPRPGSRASEGDLLSVASPTDESMPESERSILLDGTTSYLPRPGRRAPRELRCLWGVLVNDSGGEVIWPPRGQWEKRSGQELQWAAVSSTSRSEPREPREPPSDGEESLSDSREHDRPRPRLRSGLIQQIAKEVRANDLSPRTTLPPTEGEVATGLEVEAQTEAGVEAGAEARPGNAAAVREARARMMLQYMNRSVDPCSDFYSYACGRWAEAHPIPPDKVAFDVFEMLREALDAALRAELEDLPARTPEPAGLNDVTGTRSATLKAKWLYKSCMDHKVLEARGVAPLLELLTSLGGWPILEPSWNESAFDWVQLMAELRLYNNDILVSEWVGPDVKNSDQYVIQLDQTGLGLPTRDYYLTPVNAPYLRAYRDFMLEVAALLGAEAERAAAHVDEIVEFETGLAQIVASAEERRNVTQLYQRITLAELRELVPGLDWLRYLSIVLGRTPPPNQLVVVFALNYMNELVQLLGRTPRRVVSNYLLWRFVRHRINSLDDRFNEAKQRLFHVLVGREAVPPRWKSCVGHVNTHMSMAVGALFVRRHFDQHSKQDTLEMTHDIMQSFRETLNSTEWLDEETRRFALHKVDSMVLRIGYPDFLLDSVALDERYSDYDIQPDKYFENTLNILKKLSRVEQDRLGTPVNRTIWNTAPAMVNAYYSRNKNQIMFPAGILQPPFYHRHLPRSLNYGGIGVVIGHEITHGFDDKGRLFDEHGNLMRWWGDAAIENFHSRAQCLIDQYSRYTVSEVDLIINGGNTQGENIADNGGIKQAFRAYERWLSASAKAGVEVDETLPGVDASSKQLFFLNFAQVWCGSMRPEAMRNKLKIAVHSPSRFRVIGTLSNSKEFAEVFNCSLGSPMNPEEKCSVW